MSFILTDDYRLKGGCGKRQGGSDPGLWGSFRSKVFEMRQSLHDGAIDHQLITAHLARYLDPSADSDDSDRASLRRMLAEIKPPYDHEELQTFGT